jgi:hypothetical protein
MSGPSVWCASGAILDFHFKYVKNILLAEHSALMDAKYFIAN